MIVWSVMEADMRKGWGFIAAMVLGLMAETPAAKADGWRFEFRSGPDHDYRQRYRPQSWGQPVRQKCWSEFHPGPFGYTEVVRCRPIRYRGPPGWGPPPSYYWYRR
jgi:hypothetical protein